MERYEDIRAGKVKPWEDNALAVTTDGRKLALDARLVSGQAHDFPGSKINALVDNVVEHLGTYHPYSAAPSLSFPTWA